MSTIKMPALTELLVSLKAICLDDWIEVLIAEASEELEKIKAAQLQVAAESPAPCARCGHNIDYLLCATCQNWE